MRQYRILSLDSMVTDFAGKEESRMKAIILALILTFAIPAYVTAETNRQYTTIWSYNTKTHTWRKRVKKRPKSLIDRLTQERERRWKNYGKR